MREERGGGAERVRKPRIDLLLLLMIVTAKSSHKHTISLVKLREKERDEAVSASLPELDCHWDHRGMRGHDGKKREAEQREGKKNEGERKEATSESEVEERNEN